MTGYKRLLWLCAEVWSARSVHESAYLRRLVLILGAVTFFGAYASAVSAVALEDLASSFGVASGTTDLLNGPLTAIAIGAVAGSLIALLADRKGRKPVLVASTVLLALFSGVTASVERVEMFMLFQFLARAFLVGAYAVAVTMVAEEFPKTKRGSALGAITFLGALGLPAAIGLHLLVKDTSLGWRVLYLLSMLALLLVPLIRRSISETGRWKIEADPDRQRASARHWSPGWTPAMLGMIFLFSFAVLLAGSTWWNVYAEIQAGLNKSQVRLLLIVSYGVGALGYLAAGRLQDRIGRRRTGTALMAGAMLFGIIVFQTHDVAVMLVAMSVALFCGFGMSPVLAAYSSEMFPTRFRATAVGIGRGIFVTLGAILGPFITGVMADASAVELLPDLPILGDLGNTLSLLALLYLPAIFLIRKLPETAGRELENISTAEAAAPAISP